MTVTERWEVCVTDGQTLCANCGAPFERPPKSVKRTCSRSCAVAVSWKSNGAKRLASIKVARNTPESRARSIAVNNRRWSDPKNREKISRQSKRRWQQPRMRKKITAAIREAQGRPEVRARMSEVRTLAWMDPAYRDKVVSGMRLHHTSPEARARFSVLLTERWRDPSSRAKMTAANRRTAQNEKQRERQSALMRKRWAEDENYRATVLEAFSIFRASPEGIASKSAKLKALWADPIWKMQQMSLIAEALAAHRGGEGLAGRLARGCKSVARDLNSATDLMAAVDAVMPRGLPDFIRNDVCQDLMVALLDGSLKLKDLRAGAKSCLRQYNKMFPTQFGPISLDAPIPGTDGLTLIDTIADDHTRF